MDQDFEIEIFAPGGLSTLGAVLSKCPIELDLVAEDSGKVVLKQNKGSRIAGFEFDSHEDDVFTFSMYVPHKSSEPAGSVVSRFSSFLQSASLPHKITEILQEVDFDEEWVSYQWPENT
ncbi:hypothetical protein TW85_15840 [Marinomonas sp. S3726]|uniref:hypothetical protein n=1 Tax=Marinomonas sp. S3726 TaxID=579484 RepID=UPI0005F9CB75|nr:hypothetical protein [Marinomonas sp. S3726]KJZ12545.1 hypothetical protein TW85_15840 [Marinomonas sp. S3726]